MASLIAVLKQKLSRQLLATPDPASDALIVDHDLLWLAAFASKLKPRLATAQELDMAVAQRRQSVGPVRAHVLIVTDPQQGVGHDRDHQRKDGLALESCLGEIASKPAAQAGQGLTKRHDAFELLLATGLTPSRVISVLLSVARVAARRLQVATRGAADPYVVIRRRDGQRANPLQSRRIAHLPAIGVVVAETIAPAQTTQARLGVAHVDELFSASGTCASVPPCGVPFVVTSHLANLSVNSRITWVLTGGQAPKLVLQRKLPRLGGHRLEKALEA